MVARESCASDSEIAAYRNWYDKSYDVIESACRSLEHPYGFNPPLLSSVESLAAKPRLLVATLNPAGSADCPDHRGRYRYEGLNAYLDIDWRGHGLGQSPLQRQMQGVFEHLRSRTCGSPVSAVAFARSRVVTAQLIPFRSPSESSLHRRTESVAVARAVWAELLRIWLPSTAVTVGATTAQELGVVLGSVGWEGSLPIGWGVYRMTLREFDCGTRLLALPHLSRFAILGRPQSELYLKEAFDWAVGGARPRLSI